MDGEIWVESEFEKGTSFYFTIQLDKFSGDEILPQKEEELKVRKLEKKKILLAEDNELNCLVFERFIKVLELNLEIVQNGKLAVDKVQAKKFDIIFMDINMPVMVGVEATLEIRKLNIPQPRIIALTADALEESKIKFLD